MSKYLVLLSLAMLLSGCDRTSTGESSHAAANSIESVETNTPGPDQGADSIEPITSFSVIHGEITTFNDFATASNININLRGTDINSLVRSSGEFELYLPKADVDRTFAMDISGANVIPKSVSVQVPAGTDRLVVDANVSGRSAPIPFSLENGGEMSNPLSANRVSVSVPANAFEFSDGTLAIGEAEVRITEVDLEDLYGDGSWAPNLIGISEGMTEPSALVSFGMSDFHFSQNGRELQLRPGKTATIKADLLAPYVVPVGEAVLVDAIEGETIPLWYYDNEDMIWKEEGESVVVADAESFSGYSVIGEVSHFSWWNHDTAVPATYIHVAIEIVDEDGAPFPSLDVVSYTTTASVPLVQGSNWSYTTNWSNTVQMVPSNSLMQIIANNVNSELQVAESEFYTADITMDFVVNNIVVAGTGQLVTDTVSGTKIFETTDFSDNTITLQVEAYLDGDPPPPPEDPPPPPPPPPVMASVIVELVDLDGNVVNTPNVTIYEITARSDISDWTNQQILGPGFNQMTIQASTQEEIDSGQANTMEFTLTMLLAEGVGQIDLLFPIVATKVFNTSDSVHSITLQVPVIDL